LRFCPAAVPFNCAMLVLCLALALAFLSPSFVPSLFCRGPSGRNDTHRLRAPIKMIRSALSRGWSLITLNLLYRFPLPPTQSPSPSLSPSPPRPFQPARVVASRWSLAYRISITFVPFFRVSVRPVDSGISPRRYPNNGRSARIAGTILRLC